MSDITLLLNKTDSLLFGYELNDNSNIK